MAGHIGLTVIYYVLLLTVAELNDHPELTTFEWGRQFMLGTVATNLLLLTPSISYGCFLYLPFHYLSILIMTIRDDVEKGQLIQAAYASVSCIVFWYIYQKRELKRFFEQEKAELKETKAVEKEVELRHVLNLQQDAVVIFSTEEKEQVLAHDSVQPPLIPHRIEFSNMKANNLFGCELSQMPLKQLVLPQFIAVDQNSKLLQQFIEDRKSLDGLRQSINDSLWTGKSFMADGLISLKNILDKNESINESIDAQPERYIMLANVIDEEGQDEIQDRDRQLIVFRTRIDFNKKSCRLISFTDISFVQKLKLLQETNKVFEMQSSFIQNKVIGKIALTLQVALELKEKVESRELIDMVGKICCTQSLLQFNALDLLDQQRF